MTKLTTDEKFAGKESRAHEAALHGVKPNLGHILLVALVAGLFSVGWLATYNQLFSLIWQNSFVASNRWIIPVGVLFFSLLVGLAEKYLRAPNVIHGGIGEDIKEGRVGYSNFLGLLLTSYLSLFSGASVGPEGPIGFLAAQISAWLSDRLKIARESQPGLWLAGMASAYNGILGNPVFTTLFSYEGSEGKASGVFLGTNLAAGALGYMLFTLLKVPPFAGFLDVGSVSQITGVEIGWAILLGLIGVLLALLVRAAFTIAGRLMGAFNDRVILRALVAAVIIGVVSYLNPNLMFSGENVIHSILANPAQFSIGTLLLMALLKIALLGLSFKSGFMGGPTFPAIFAATMVALALSSLFPTVPLALLVTGIVVSLVTLVLRAPFASILLVVVMSSANTILFGLICISAATGLLATAALEQITARRAAQQEQ